MRRRWVQIDDASDGSGPRISWGLFALGKQQPTTTTATSAAATSSGGGGAMSNTGASSATANVNGGVEFVSHSLPLRGADVARVVRAVAPMHARHCVAICAFESKDKALLLFASSDDDANAWVSALRSNGATYRAGHIERLHRFARKAATTEPVALTDQEWHNQVCKFCLFCFVVFLF